MVKETKRSPISRPSALFPFSTSVPLPLPFSSLLRSNNIGNDLTDAGTHWGPQHLDKGQCHGLCAMQVKPSHGDSLQGHRGTMLSAPTHLERLF